MKKISIALLAATVLAGAASANQTGFFAGVGAVTGSLNGNYKDVSSTGVNNGTTEAGKTMLGGRLEVGYGMTFAGCGYTSISAYGTLLNAKVNVGTAPIVDGFGNNGTAKVELRNKSNVGVEVKLGYHFTKDIVGFVGIAAEAGKYQLKNTNTIGGTVVSSFTASKTKFYAKPVVGVRTLLNRNIFVEAKYGYGIANSMSMKLGTTATADTVTVKPRTHEFSVTVGWKF